MATLLPTNNNNNNNNINSNSNSNINNNKHKLRWKTLITSSCLHCTEEDTTSSMTTQQQAAAATVETLETLLERQKLDVQETERLLRTMLMTSIDNDNDNTNDNTYTSISMTHDTKQKTKYQQYHENNQKTHQYQYQYQHQHQHQQYQQRENENEEIDIVNDIEPKEEEEEEKKSSSSSSWFDKNDSTMSDSIFDRIDTDQDDAITKDELQTHLESIGYSNRAVQTLFGAFDKNEDGLISRAEMRAAQIDSDIGIGTSIRAGVHYGFESRSEGATFQSIKGTRLGWSTTTTTITTDNDNTDDTTTNKRAAPIPVAAFGEDGGYYGPPANIVTLAIAQFQRNLNAIRGEYKVENNLELTPKQIKMQDNLEQLTLNSTAIWERETKDGPIVAPFVLKIPYIVLCYILDGVFEGRYVPSRFFLLETVARMPYFSYITMLHLYETLGFWRQSSDVKRVHFAQEWNEYNHLLIMESLGGDQTWWVRFVAQHSAIIYYLVLCSLWALSPTLAYKFSDLLETHAVNTYGQFLDENEERLRSLPPSIAAVTYYSYGASDPFFGEYQTTAIAKGIEIRQPGNDMQSLFDVFKAIQADEMDHVGTMQACLDPDVAVNSPSIERKILTGAALVASVGYFINIGAITTTGISSMDGLSDVFDGAAAIDDTSLITAAVDAIIAGAIGLAENLGGGIKLQEGADMLEADVYATLLQTMRQVVITIVELLSRFLR